MVKLKERDLLVLVLLASCVVANQITFPEPGFTKVNNSLSTPSTIWGPGISAPYETNSWF